MHAPPNRHPQKTFLNYRKGSSLLPLQEVLNCSYLTRSNLFISSNSIFGDMTWDFSEKDSGASRHEMIIKFHLGEGWREDELPLLDSLKCFAYSLVVDPPHPKIRFATIIKNFARGGIVNLVRFMKKRRVSKFSELSFEEFEAFLDQEQTRPHSKKLLITDRTLRSRVRGIDWLAMQTDKLNDSLKFDPWQKYGSHGSWANAVAMTVVERGVLQTFVIPDAVVKQLVIAAMQTIGESADLQAATIAFKNHGVVHKTEPLGCDQITDPLAYSKRPSSSFPSGHFGFKDGFELTAKYNRIRVATFILIGLLTGMRPIEILSIPADPTEACIDEMIEINGSVLKCHFVVSTLTKNLPTATTRNWQTVPIVIEAIRSLAELNAHIFSDSSPWLFRSPKKRARNGYIHDAQRLSHNTISTSMRSFVTHHKIHNNNHETWKTNLSGRSLRRTFARLVTRNGMGLIELQDQLKHYDPDVTSMYGQPSLSLHLHEEKVNLSEELYQELLAGVSPIVGGGANALNTMRQEFKGLTRPNQNHFIKALSAKALIDQVDLGLCIYKRDKALCGGNKVNCKPDQCLNSIVPLNSAIRSLKNRKNENERLLAIFKKNSLKQTYLRSQLLTINNLLAQADDLDKSS